MRKPYCGAAVDVFDVAAAVVVVAVIGVAVATDAAAVTSVAVVEDVAVASGGNRGDPVQIHSDSKRPIDQRPH